MIMPIYSHQSQVLHYDFPFSNNFLFFLELMSTFRKGYLVLYLLIYHSFVFRLPHCTVRLSQHVHTLGDVSFFCPFSSSCPNLDWNMLVIWGFPLPSVLHFPLSSSLTIFLFLWVHDYFIYLLPFL